MYYYNKDDSIHPKYNVVSCYCSRVIISIDRCSSPQCNPKSSFLPYSVIIKFFFCFFNTVFTLFLGVRLNRPGGSATSLTYSVSVKPCRIKIRPTVTTNTDKTEEKRFCQRRRRRRGILVILRNEHGDGRAEQRNYRRRKVSFGRLQSLSPPPGPRVIR